MSKTYSGDLLAFSHLRWDWVFQRPQHLMMRAAATRRVYFLEEPEFGPHTVCMTQRAVAPNLTVVTPRLPEGLSHDSALAIQKVLLDEWLRETRVSPQTLWYYTPAALEFSAHLTAQNLVYDCMDELTAFAGAAASLSALERRLLQRSDVVFTGGISLYEAKRHLHNNVHAMPSCVDLAHFRKARSAPRDHPRQVALPRPRVGYCGVIDERLDLPLMRDVARLRPDCQFVFAGPVCKIDPNTLPVAPNIHYLGPIDYSDLPQLMGGWQVAWMPFAMNEATRFISPTKTPEYLAAALPVVSSPVRDVVRTWGDQGFVLIAAEPRDFARSISAHLAGEVSPSQRARIDETLALYSWDGLWTRMDSLMRASAINAA